jgi:FlaA1/EpsC-like NDP-sugar epimerase
MLALKSKKLTGWLLLLPRHLKQGVIFCVDVLLSILAIWISLVLRLDTLTPPIHSFYVLTILSITIVIPTFLFTRLYSTILRHSGVQSFYKLTWSVLLYGIVFAFIVTLINVAGVPRSIGILQPLILFLLLSASRWIMRRLLSAHLSSSSASSGWPMVLIYGAGEAGRQLVNSLMTIKGWRLAGLVDSDSNLWGGTIEGYRVYDPSLIPIIIERKSVNELWLAMPGITVRQRADLIDSVRNLGVRVRTLPTFQELASEKFNLHDVQELNINDFLGRPLVEPNEILLHRNISGRKILVTGAGGSVGSELCRQIIKLGPSMLI